MKGKRVLLLFLAVVAICSLMIPGATAADSGEKEQYGPLIVVSEDQAWVYDGQAHTHQVYYVEYGGYRYGCSFAGGEYTCTLPTGDHVRVTPCNAGADGITEIGNVKNEFTWTVDNENSYRFKESTFGELKITKINLYITMADRTLMYNGCTQYGCAQSDEAAEIITGALDGHEVSINYTQPKGETVGTYSGSYDKDTLTIKHGDEDVSGLYQVSVTAGKLTIEKAKLTIIMSDRTLTYNGANQQGWLRSDGGMETITGLVNGETVDIEYTPAQGVDVGTYNNGSYDVSTLKIMDGERDVTGNYSLVSAMVGKLTITPCDEKFTISLDDDSYTYDAQEHNNTATPSSTAFGGETVYSYSFSEDNGYVTSLSDLKKVDAGDYTIYVIGKNPNYSSSARTTAVLSIKPAKLKITAKDQTFEYTGDIQGPGDTVYDDSSLVIMEGLQGTDVLTSFTLEGQAKEVGKHSGVIKPNQATIMRGNKKVNDNYEITYVNGTLIIAPSAKLSFAVSGRNDDTKYHVGEPIIGAIKINSFYQEAKEITISISEGFTFGTVPPTSIGASESIELTVTHTVTSADVERGKVTIRVEVTIDGESLESTDSVLTETMDITVTVKGHTNVTTYDGNGAEAKGYDLSCEDPLFDEAKVVYSGTAIVKGTEPGVYPMGLNADLFAYKDPAFKAVFNVEDGGLEIKQGEPKIETYEITFVDEDGTILKAATNYEAGTPADKIVKPEEPSKAEDSSFTYTFDGWSPEIEAVIGNATYKATYKKTAKPGVYEAFAGAGGTWTKRSGSVLTFTFKRTENDETTFGHFAGIQVDGKAVPEKDEEGNLTYTTKTGSVVVTLQPDYLETLVVGVHEMTVGFDDGEDVIVKFTVEAAKEVEPEVTPEETLEATPEATPEVTPEATPEATPEVTPEATPEVTPEATPEVTPEVTPEATPEVTPEVTPEPTPEPVEESVVKSGDTAETTMYFLGLFVSMLAIGTVIVRRKQRSRA